MVKEMVVGSRCLTWRLWGLVQGALMVLVAEVVVEQAVSR